MIVILLCGVPACGKSTFVKAFLAYLQTQPTLIPRVISYDKISEQLDWNEESFINARQQAKSQLLGFLQEISLSSNEQSKDPTNLILIDDTMHLRSMRREIYVITRDHSIPLLTLWLNIDPSIALERNRFRNLYENGNVSEESFLRVSETFQPPDPSFIFDRYSMMIQSDVTQYRFDEVFTFIMKRMNEFALELAEKRQRQENERNLQTSQQQLRHQPKDSKIYDLDDRLRKMISEIVCWWKEIITDIHRRSLLKDLTKMLSEKKQSVLERIRYDVHHCDTFLDSNYIQSFVFDVCEDLSCQLAKTIDPSTNLLLSQLLNVLDQLLLV